MRRSYSKSIVPLMLKSIGLTMLVTVGFVVIDAAYRLAERKLNMFELLDPSALGATVGAIFGGVVAALAIHNSFNQTAREKRFELRISEHENAVGRVVELIGQSIAVNTLPKLVDMPDCMDEVRHRRQVIFNLYSFVEQNYASVLISGILFEIECENQNNNRLMDMEEKMAGSQKTFADAYRRLYHALHDYMNHSLNGMETLYSVTDNSGRLVWIWEHSDYSHLELWGNRYGRDFSEEVAKAFQTQNELVTRITQYAVETRDALTEFSEQFKLFERAALLYGRPSTSSQAVNRLRSYKDNCVKNPVR